MEQEEETIAFLQAIQKRSGMYGTDCESYDKVTAFVEGYVFSRSYFDSELYQLAKIASWYGITYQQKKVTIPLASYLKKPYPEKDNYALLFLYSELLIIYFSSGLDK